jgi:hypothetical protein
VVQDAVLLHEPEKQRGSNELVSVHKTVILDEKIKEVRGLLLPARIEVFAVECLHHRAQRYAQALIFFPSEQIRSAKFAAQLPDDGHRLIVVNAPGFLRFQAGDGNPLVIVIIQQIEGEGIVRNHAKKRTGLVRCHVVPL